MKTTMKILLAFALLALTAAAAHAETRYVSDQLVISLRAGKGTEFKAVGYLRTGDPVDVLATEGDYLKVRTLKGKEGWVRKRYITSEQPKAEIISGLQKEIADLKAAQADAGDLTAERDRLMAENGRLAKENRTLESEFDNVKRKKYIPWFLAGAGVLFLGWLIGRASRQKRFY